MSDSNSDNTIGAARVTLKLKGAARKIPTPPKAEPLPQSPRKSSQKPGAAWSDEYKERMQADMDALASR
jgi:hypothetical protein